MTLFQNISAGVLAAASVVLAATATSAQTYPARYVRIITAGAGTFHDIVARHLAHRLSERWGQAVVVENQPAAGLTIGSAIVAKAPPDGYTLLLGDRSSLAAAPTLHKTLRYDPAKDFLPVTLVARSPALLTAHPRLPADNLRDFIALARQQSNSIIFASAGLGSFPHLTGVQLGQSAGFKLQAVHYKGGPPAAMAVLSGEATFAALTLPVVLPQVKSGAMKPLAVTSPKRFSGAPDIPTADEAGVPGFEAEQWVGMLVPARTPSAIVDKLNRDIVEILRSAAFQEMLRAQGAEAAPGTPDELAAFMASERRRLKEIIETAGLTGE